VAGGSGSPHCLKPMAARALAIARRATHGRSCLGVRSDSTTLGKQRADDLQVIEIAASVIRSARRTQPSCQTS